MKEFDIKIKETLEKTVTVQAENRQDAEEMVRQAYFDGEHILDADNFSEVDFSVDAEREVQLENQEKLNVLLVKPGMYPQQVQIDPGLAALQQAVEGDIEAAYYFEEPVAIIVNDEGKLNGSELNRAICDQDGNIVDIIAGNFLVVGLGEEDFCSLSPDMMKKFEEKFHQPEMFVRMGKSIMALPLPDDMVRKTDAPEKGEKPPVKNAPDREAL